MQCEPAMAKMAEEFQSRKEAEARAKRTVQSSAEALVTVLETPTGSLRLLVAWGS